MGVDTVILLVDIGGVEVIAPAATEHPKERNSSRLRVVVDITRDSLVRAAIQDSVLLFGPVCGVHMVPILESHAEERDGKSKAQALLSQTLKTNAIGIS